MGNIVKISEVVKQELEGYDIKLKEDIGVDTILKCEKCGEPNYLIYADGSGEVSECSCVKKENFRGKVKKFKELSVFDKLAEGKTFEKSIVTNDKEKGYISSFKKFCDNFETFKGCGYKLVLAGNTGVGKTYNTACIYNRLKTDNKIINFNLSKYLGEIKKSENFDIKETELLKMVADADLIMIDDIGSEKLTEWGKEKVYNLMDTVYRLNINLVLSTNFKKTGLEEFLMFNGSDKIVDRLRENSKYYAFDWESRRKTNSEDIPF